MSRIIEILKRARRIGKYIVENNATIEQTAEVFGVSKRTVRRAIDDWLCYSDKNLQAKVFKVLENNASKKGEK